MHGQQLNMMSTTLEHIRFTDIGIKETIRTISFTGMWHTELLIPSSSRMKTGRYESWINVAIEQSMPPSARAINREFAEPS